MKHLFSLFFLLLLTLPASAQSVGLTEELTTYREAALQMLHAWEKGNKYGLYSAKEKFQSIVLVEFSPADYLLEGTFEDLDALKATFFFTPRQINDILSQMDDVVEIDPPSALRGERIALIHNFLKAGSALSYRISGRDYCQALVIPTCGKNLLLTIEDETCGETYQGQQEADSSTWAGWTMSQPGSFIIRVENATDEDCSFVVALP